MSYDFEIFTEYAPCKDEYLLSKWLVRSSKIDRDISDYVFPYFIAP
jgi:hypothetical protein